MTAVSRGLQIQWLATVSSLALVGTAAAADMGYPVKAAPAYVAAPNWEGFYAGGNLGAAWNHWRFFDPVNSVGVSLFGDNGTSPFWSGNKAAFTFGGQVGYNWQSANFVYGVEADLNWVDSKNNAILAPNVNQTLSVSTKLDGLATFRGRLGATITPATLLYATGGLALAHVKDSINSTANANAGAITNDRTLAGYAVGGGVEYMFMQNWTAKLEGLYIGLPNTTVTTNRFSANNSYQSEFKHSAALARIGINHKF